MAGRVPCRRRHHLPTLFRHQVGPVADAAFLSFDDVADSLTLHPESPGDVDLSRPALCRRMISALRSVRGAVMAQLVQGPHSTPERLRPDKSPPVVVIASYCVEALPQQ